MLPHGSRSVKRPRRRRGFRPRRRAPLASGWTDRREAAAGADAALAPLAVPLVAADAVELLLAGAGRLLDVAVDTRDDPPAGSPAARVAEVDRHAVLQR